MYKNLHTLLMFAQYFISLSHWWTSVYLQIELKTLYKWLKFIKTFAQYFLPLISSWCS